RTPGGDPLMPQGAVMTAREWVRFGEFVRAGGKAGGRSLVDPATFRQLFRSSAANPGYGITWWLPHAQAAGGEGPSSDFGRNAARLPADLVVAAGAGDQRLYVIPSRRMTIVRLASFSLRDAVAERRGGAAVWSDTEFLETLLGSPGR
ncbi:MAG TPA: hypothetical protein VFW47_14665, partial [Phenylobacterium sp.]|nr:hypothetical protein [Phenylobacterium sp.]